MSDYNFDGDDVRTLALAGGNGSGGCISSILFLIVLVILWSVARDNDADCAKRKCPEGSAPKVIKRDCLCITKASP